MPPKPTPIARGACGLLLALGPSLLPISRWDNELADIPHMLANEMIWWVLVGALLAYVVRIERQPLASVGFRAPGWRGSLLGLAAGAAVFIGLGVITLALLPALHLQANTGQFGQLMAAPLWWRAISVIRAGVAEELFFRGYAIERIETLSGSRAAAAIVSCAAFTIAHLSDWGWAHLIVAGFGGAAFTLLYLWRRNLWTNILAHVVVDGAAFLA